MHHSNDVLQARAKVKNNKPEYKDVYGLVFVIDVSFVCDFMGSSRELVA